MGQKTDYEKEIAKRINDTVLRMKNTYAPGLKSWWYPCETSEDRKRHPYFPSNGKMTDGTAITTYLKRLIWNSIDYSSFPPSYDYGFIQGLNSFPEKISMSGVSENGDGKAMERAGVSFVRSLFPEDDIRGRDESFFRDIVSAADYIQDSVGIPMTEGLYRGLADLRIDNEKHYDLLCDRYESAIEESRPLIHRWDKVEEIVRSHKMDPFVGSGSAMNKGQYISLGFRSPRRYILLPPIKVSVAPNRIPDSIDRQTIVDAAAFHILWKADLELRAEGKITCKLFDGTYDPEERKSENPSLCRVVRELGQFIRDENIMDLCSQQKQEVLKKAVADLDPFRSASNRSNGSNVIPFRTAQQGLSIER